MKFPKLLAVFILLIYFVTGPVSAQTTDTTATDSSATSLTPQRPLSTDQRETIKSKITEIKDRIASQSSELRQRLSDKVRQHVTELLQVMLKRMRHLLDRQASILSRLQSRIEKLQKDGKTISTTTSDLLTQAQQSHAKSIEQLATLQSQFTLQILDSETPRTGLALVRQLVQEFKQQFATTHRLIKQVLSELQKVQQWT